MRARRKFSLMFQQQLCEEILAGRFTASQIARKYDLHSSTVSTWLHRYQAGYMGADVKNVDEDPAMLQARIAELERMVGKLAVENEALKKISRSQIPWREGGGLMLSGLKSAQPEELASSSASPEAPTITKAERNKKINKTRSNYATK